MNDTLADAERVRIEAIRRTDPIERMRIALAHSESIRELALSHQRSLHPGASDLELVELLLGVQLVPVGFTR